MNRPSRTPELLASGVLGLAVAAGVLVVIEGRAPPRERATDEFQRLVGGLGFGPAVDVARCPFGFDPRLDPDDQEDQEPIPGGYFFCPHHGAGVFAYPPLDWPGPPPTGDGDGQAP
jgi:hypothetical protein